MMYTLTEAQEEELIEKLNAVDSAWRETYESVIEAAVDLLPAFELEGVCGDDDAQDDYAPLNFHFNE